ncbi:MAG: hypothetical protein ACOYT4_05195 [Nanoarchaeota archaeon]
MHLNLKIDKKEHKQAQVWVETVIYTLIGLSIIGLLLAVSRPKINSIKDQIAIEQTIEILNKIDSKIYEVQKAPGNKRILELKISKGTLTIDAKNEQIFWKMNSRYEYSQPGENIPVGNLIILTETAVDSWDVLITLNYSDKNFNFTYAGENAKKEIDSAPTSYYISLENLGVDSNNKILVDFNEN